MQHPPIPILRRPSLPSPPLPLHPPHPRPLLAALAATLVRHLLDEGSSKILDLHLPLVVVDRPHLRASSSNTSLRSVNSSSQERIHVILIDATMRHPTKTLVEVMEREVGVTIGMDKRIMEDDDRMMPERAR